jgi:DNA-binding MarR family transcriptional regulator
MNEKPFEDLVDIWIARVARMHHARSQQIFSALGLHRGQPPLLFRLWEREGRTHSELAESMNVTPATISNMVKRMEKSNLVIRRSDPNDERVSRVYLTDKGRRLEEDVMNALRNLNDEQVVGFTEKEQELFRSFLVRVYENLKEAEGEK